MSCDVFKNLVIFEMANNHQGSLEHGLEIIRAYAALADRYRLHAGIKLQYRNLPDFVHPDCRQSGMNTMADRFLGTLLPREAFSELVQAMKNAGLLAICTPFDEVSVSRCVEHHMDILKIASCSALDWPLHEAVAEAGKPVIVSTGGLGLLDIDRIYNFYTHREIPLALLHCSALYPAPEESLQMNWIDRLRRRYPGVHVGYSGHEATDNISVGQIAIAKGATILERHVGIPTETIELNAYSMNALQTEEWLQAIVEARMICGGSGVYDARIVPDAEKNSLSALMRGVFAARTIQAGETLTMNDVFFALPREAGQMHSGEFRSGLVATRDYEFNAPMYESFLHDSTYILRQGLHMAKGMLAENNIAIAKNTEFEISHHYGMYKFLEWGCVIINVVNREYCKKLLVVLPGQKHPAHIHKVKEETFCVLTGDLLLDMGGTQTRLLPGCIATVERGAQHAFTSETGTIIEEISTTQEKNDSYYIDQCIQRQVPIIRKTILKTW